MAENKLPENEANDRDPQRPEMYVNDYGSTIDPTVVVDEADRTVLLTPDETLVIEKQPTLEISPRNRPRKVYSGMWGQAEIVSVGVGMLALLTVVLIYAFLVIPSNSELEKNRAERDRLERELNTANSKYGNITSTESQVATLLNSVDNFETQYLPVASLGKNAVYQRINGLIATHGLVNTSGPDYSPLEFANQNADQNKEEEKGRAKFRSIYPGMYVTMTVEGSYQNLRRFIADIERSGDFLIISSIELQPSDSDGQQQSAPEPQPVRPVTTSPQVSKNPSSPNMYPAPGMMSPVVTNFGQAHAPKGKVHGDNISLRIELATYFRRPNFVPTNTLSAQ